MKYGNISNRAALSTVCFRVEDLLFPRKLFNQFSRTNIDAEAYRAYLRLLRSTDFGVTVAIHAGNVGKVAKLGLFDTDTALCYTNAVDVSNALARGEVTYFVGDDAFVAQVHHRAALTLETLSQYLHVGDAKWAT